MPLNNPLASIVATGCSISPYSIDSSIDMAEASNFPSGIELNEKQDKR